MASVFVGEHMLLGHKVAIKVLQKRHLKNAAIERRFFNEAKVIASIRHPNIVEIFDFGRADTGAAFIVMELLEGQTLRSRIRRGIMPERQSVIFMRQLSAALAEAHAKGVIHRDLKPDNVFIIEDEEVELGERIKLLDFGIAKRIDPDQGMQPASEQTATGILVGTPAYMSPEQCKGLGEIDGRSDVYSLGVVLYRMLTNQLPFEAGGTGELIGKHLYVEPAPPTELNNEISKELEDIVMTCLAKEPGDRFQNMSDLANAFGDLLSTESTRHQVSTSPPAAHSGAAATARASARERHIHPSNPTPFSSSSEISATTLRTATGEQVAPALVLGESTKGRNWALWTAAGCIAAMLIGVLALSGGDDSAAPSPSAAQTSADRPDETSAGTTTPDGTTIETADDPATAGAATAASEKAAAEKAAAEKAAAERAAAEKVAAEKAAAEKLAAEKAAAERLAAEKAAAEKETLAALEKNAAAKKAASATKRAAEKRAAEKRAEKRIAEKRAAEKRAAEKRAAEKRAADKRAADKRAADKRAVAKARAKARADKGEQKKKKTINDVKTPMVF